MEDAAHRASDNNKFCEHLTTSGMRQECVLAPALFYRATDLIMEHISPEVGVQVIQHSFANISYTDHRINIQSLNLPWKRGLEFRCSHFLEQRQRHRI